jgi:hypothetical protein
VSRVIRKSSVVNSVYTDNPTPSENETPAIDAHCSPWDSAIFIDRQHLASVTGMFSLEPLLESRYAVLKIGGAVAVHFISARTAGYRTGHALRLKSIPALPDFFLKFRFAEHISSVGFWHLLSLPQFFSRGTDVLSPSLPDVFEFVIEKRAPVVNGR